MRNLACYTEDSFAAFTDAVKRKTDVNAKAKLIAEYETIQSKYQNYDILFAANELEFLVDDGVHAELHTDLQGLYDSDKALVGDIRKKVESLQHRAIRYTCQYCTLESPNTLDHVVPQSEFPVFAIHPKNLIPSCGSCNGFKGHRWRVGTDRNLINFYTDQLPDFRYLEVLVFQDEYTDIDFRYRLRCPAGMNHDLYQLILRHFAKLHLLERMRRGAIKHLVEFENLIKPLYLGGESRANLTDCTMESCNAERAVLGENHWKPAMMEALVKSDLFWARL